MLSSKESENKQSKIDVSSTEGKLIGNRSNYVCLVESELKQKLLLTKKQNNAMIIQIEQLESQGKSIYMHCICTLFNLTALCVGEVMVICRCACQFVLSVCSCCFLKVNLVFATAIKFYLQLQYAP